MKHGSRLRESNSGPTHYEIVQRLMVANGQCGSVLGSAVLSEAGNGWQWKNGGRLGAQMTGVRSIHQDPRTGVTIEQGDLFRAPAWTVSGSRSSSEIRLAAGLR